MTARDLSRGSNAFEMADEATRNGYRDAWEAWMKQLERVHEVLLEGERPVAGPAQGTPEPGGAGQAGRMTRPA